MLFESFVKIVGSKKIVILGLGDENRQFVNWLVEVANFNPKQILIADKKRPNLENLEILDKLEIKKENHFFGENYLEILQNLEIEFVFKSPGIWSNLPELEFFREQKAQFNNEQFELDKEAKKESKNQQNGELTLDEDEEEIPEKIERVLSPLVFFASKFRTQIIGVTGTKGKTTTSSLIEHFLKHKIGNTRFELDAENLDHLDNEDFNLEQNPNLNEKLENSVENVDLTIKNENLETKTEIENIKNLEELETQNWDEIGKLQDDKNLAENIKQAKTEFYKNLEEQKLKDEEKLAKKEELEKLAKLEQRQKILQQLSNNQKVFYCGNTTGISPYQYWKKLDQKVDSQKFFVIELSSFQLQDLNYSRISPKYAVITNFFIDHLDQHNNKFEYWKAKTAIFAHQNKGDFLISGEQFLQQTQYIGSQIYQELGNNQIDQYYFEEPLNQEFIIWKEVFVWLKSFYTTNLLGEHNWQNLILAMFVTEIVVENWQNSENIELTAKNINDLKQKIDENYYINIDKLQNQLEILKENSPENSQSTQKISFYAILQNIIRHNIGKNQEIINTFVPIGRRLELLRSLNLGLEGLTDLQIQFFDDTAATEPDAVIAAIDALTNSQNSNQKQNLTSNSTNSEQNQNQNWQNPKNQKVNQFLWLIVAGKDKGGNLSELANKILDKIKENQIFKLSLCGEVGQNLANEIWKLAEEIKKNDDKNSLKIKEKLLLVLGANNLEKEITKFKEKIPQEINSKKIKSEFISFFGQLKTAQNNLESLKNEQLLIQNTDPKVQLNVVFSPSGSSYDEFETVDARSQFWQSLVASLE